MAKASKISNWFLWWIVYGFIGWAYETIVCSIDAGHFVIRGFLYGPVCPIYGTAAVLAIAVLYRHVKNVVLLFITGTSLTITLEYVTSVVLERLFGLRWWDYSNYRYNIDGRVSLVGAAVFGVMVVLLIKFVHPRIEALAGRIGDRAKIVLASVLAGALTVDFCMTLIHLHSIGH